MHMGGPGADSRSDAQARKDAYRMDLEQQVSWHRVFLNIKDFVSHWVTCAV